MLRNVFVLRVFRFFCAMFMPSNPVERFPFRIVDRLREWLACGATDIPGTNVGMRGTDGGRRCDDEEGRVVVGVGCAWHMVGGGT